MRTTDRSGVLGSFPEVRARLHRRLGDRHHLRGLGLPETSEAAIDVANDLRTWFLILAFVSIGLEFKARSLREAGWRPIAVFAAATGVNLVVGLGLAVLLFSWFTF